MLLSGTAPADTRELWPELDLYASLGPTARLYFLSSYARGKESDFRSLDLTGYVDVTVKPILWPSLLAEDWATKKYLWLRVGYDHIFNAEGGVRAVPEERGIVSLFARAHLPAEVLLEGRARADLRWKGGEYSTRYRLRVEVNRELNPGVHAVTPWFNAEYFYDTRYDGWARELYQLGVECGVTPHFKVEPYLARQRDLLPEVSGLWALGLVARWYS